MDLLMSNLSNLQVFINVSLNFPLFSIYIQVFLQDTNADSQNTDFDKKDYVILNAY